MQDREYSQNRGIVVSHRKFCLSMKTKLSAECTTRSSYKRTKRKIKRQTDFGDLRQKWEKPEGAKQKRFLENLGTCVRYTLYPRFCTCISCTVIVVRPSTLSSLFVIAFLIRPRAKYSGTDRNAYLNVCIYIACWLENCMNEHARKKPSHKALHWYRLRRYCSLVHSKL